MLRCLIFLWPDFSQVGLRRRGESKKSATWGGGWSQGRRWSWPPVGGRRWVSKGGCCKAIRTGGHSASSVHAPERDWAELGRSVRWGPGRKTGLTLIWRRSLGTRLERCYWRAWKSEKRPVREHRDGPAGSRHGQAACCVDLMKTRVRPSYSLPLRVLC